MTNKIRIDTGGTFTDCFGEDSKGVRRIVKILSSGRLRVKISKILDPRQLEIEIPESWNTPPGFFANYSVSNHLGQSSKVIEFSDGIITLMEEMDFDHWLDLFTGEEAPVVGARLLTGTGCGESFPGLDFRLATTRGTNALLERKGAPLALFINKGFGDLLAIGDQRRSDLFALRHRKRSPMHRSVVEVAARMSCDGKVEIPLRFDTESKTRIEKLVNSGVKTAAVAFLHSYRNPEHEREMKDYLLENGFEHVSISSGLAPLIKILPRAETAVANAYLHPVLQDFLNQIQEAVGFSNKVYTMTSAGGLEPVEVFRPKDSLLSGPAGGVAGAAAIAKGLGIDRVLTFDMGGTSTDVARYDAGFIYRFEQKVGDARLLSTALKIETVASGGGSICQWTNAGIRVGPESAGADPGPACYGRGGPLTITDVNLLLNRIDPENFGIPISKDQVGAAKQKALELQLEAGLSDTEIDTIFLEGLLDIANEQMADAIRTISIRDGADPAEYALLAFGGAGPLHACAIAEKLHIEKIIIPGEAGILSAYGLEHSAIERIAEAQVNLPVSSLKELKNRLGEVTARAEKLLRDAGQDCKRFRFMGEARLKGQDSCLTIDFDHPSELEEGFLAAYEKIFGYRPPGDREIEIVSFRVIAVSAMPRPDRGEPVTQQGTVDDPTGSGATSYPVTSRFVERTSIPDGSRITKPCVIQDPFSTFYLPEGWNATRVEGGSLVVQRVVAMSSEVAREKPEEILRELFRHRFEHVVEEMGAMLERSAISTNVKERLDFSCALLDHEGRLICSANHIPVHLGAMGLCVRKVKEVIKMGRGDTIITNHPGLGGSHLPDVTLITPVYSEGVDPVAFVANRAHHAEIGGMTPGSMPPHATSLEEEGVVISPRHLIENGNSRFAEIEKILLDSPYPTRRVSDNLADLHAQVAANRRGVFLLEDLMLNHGQLTIESQLDGVLHQSRRAIEKHIADLGFKEGRSTQHLDDGTRISVSIGNRKGVLVFDFTGSAESHPGNLNATPAIIQSAVLYVLRLWTQSSLPLNEGLMEKVEIVLPRCFLNPEFDSDPSLCPAVVGGNVETSQRIVDALIEALGIQACSQGTMNNLIFGDDTFGYYETIAGGAGAGDGYNGASGLHTHMTNTAITDPEILESRYPVRLDEFSIRRGSGGKGAWHGGDGVVREITFLKPLRVSLLTQHRIEEPFGMKGGSAGKRGVQFIDGKPVEGSCALRLNAGQILRIETPGGGGYGRMESEK